ncbi:hypothetical protein H4582DRAFT_1816063, partial [Lactarius indigo]
GITYDSVEAGFIDHVYGASAKGQAVLYQLSLTGVPIANMNNNYSTGSTALAYTAAVVRAGYRHCRLRLALGSESRRMASGALGTNTTSPDLPIPV